MKQNYLYIMKLKTKGFLLIELIFSIALISVILTSLLYMVHTSTLGLNQMKKDYENSLNVEFSLDYIFNEIDSADKIIVNNIYGISQKDQLGLMIINKGENDYSITSYVLRDKNIYRVNFKSKGINNNYSFFDFSGRNSILENVDEFSCSINNENKLLMAKITSEDYTLEEYHKIRGVIINE